jgi:hypothetical protein
METNEDIAPIVIGIVPLSKFSAKFLKEQIYINDGFDTIG